MAPAAASSSSSSSSSSPAIQKRWLTASTGKLSTADVVNSLAQDGAWDLLSPETRRRLYSLLPAAPESSPHDGDVHPFQTRYKDHIITEIKAWQHDLREGRETKKWRDEALRAGHDRARGLWDEWKEAHREETWGQ